MSFDAGFNEKELVLEDGLSFKERVFRYQDVYQDLLDAYDRVENEVLAADQIESYARLKAVMPEHDRISALLLPFVSGHQEAKRLADRGYKLSNWEGALDPEPSDDDVAGGGVDAIVALFMLYLEAAVDEVLQELRGAIEEALDDPSVTDVLTVVSGAVLLQALADKWFRSDDNNELARFMRDPIRRPEQILRNWRDKLLDGDSKNIFSKTVGRPVREIVRTGKRVEKELRRWRRKLF